MLGGGRKRHSAAPGSAPGASVDEVLAAVRADPRLGEEVVHVAALEGSPSRFGDPDPPLPAALAAGLATQGVERLWSHQSEGMAALRAGRDVLLTTPTASGKSLVYQLPVLEEALASGDGRALFLFPLKALGQDQKGKLDALAAATGLAGGEARCEIYDGDTPSSRRAAIRRDPPRVVVSNPDMLQLGILPHWHGWAPFLKSLRWVVLDELHTYRGIFGSHFHHVLRRLLRLCATAGSRPQLVASSATAANAAEFAATLTGREPVVIERSGAPRAGRRFLLMRPEASPYTSALRLLVLLLEAGLKTIVFTKARRITELLYSWLREQDPALAGRVASYRAGFLPEERRDIERRLFEGELDGVVSTSALEMGIDVGGLDACILVGYPGSVMATWQRSGRVGRLDRESLTALVALPDALDQYFLEHPGELLGRPFERLVLDPGNPHVARAHLVCAAAEQPLNRARDADYLEAQAVTVGELLTEGRLVESAEADELYTAERRPQRHVNLRGTGQTYSIVDAGRGRTIGTIDAVRAMHECHPGAIYFHAGRQYLVAELAAAERRVAARQVDVDYFTAALTEKETEILEVFDTLEEGPLVGGLGRLRVTERVVGFERKRIHGQAVLGQETVELPPVELETVGLWWQAPRAVETALRLREQHLLGSLHAAEHAAIALFPLLALCDRGDIGGISTARHAQLGGGAVFVYDGHAGGVGIAEAGFRDLPALLDRVRRLIADCPCEAGCPSCVHSPKCGNGNRPLDKPGAARLLALLLGVEELPVALEKEPMGMQPGGVVSPRPRALSGFRTTGDAVEGTAGQARRGTEVVEGREISQRAQVASGTEVSPATVVSSRTLLFDLETLRSAEEVGGWENAHRMGLALGVVCHLEEGRFEVFREEQVRALTDTLAAADLVVGFNVERFDYRVLAGYTGADYARLWPTLDLLQEIRRRLGFRIGLNHLAQETLGVTKTADGLQSLEWVRQGKLDLVEAYCRRDVEITRDLYLFGRREGYVCYRDRQQRRVRLQVDW